MSGIEGRTKSPEPPLLTFAMLLSAIAPVRSNDTPRLFSVFFGSSCHVVTACTERRVRPSLARPGGCLFRSVLDALKLIFIDVVCIVARDTAIDARLGLLCTTGAVPR